MGKNRRRKKGVSLLQMLQRSSGRGEGGTSSALEAEAERNRGFMSQPRRRYIANTPLGSSSFSWNPLIRGNDDSVGNCIALDCEMVGAGLRGCVTMLGRCSIVNHYGNILYDTFVAPLHPVTDYRTAISGIRRADLEGAPSFTTVQSEVKDFLRGRLLVGHDLRHDFRVLDISHPSHMIRDTSEYALNPFRRHTGNNRSRLCDLISSVGNVEIQTGEHSSVEDAQATMYIYQHFKDEWERSLSTAPGHSAWSGGHSAWSRVGAAGRGGMMEEHSAGPVSRAQRRAAVEPLGRAQRQAGAPFRRPQAQGQVAEGSINRAQRRAAVESLGRAQRQAGVPPRRPQEQGSVRGVQRQAETNDSEGSDDELPGAASFGEGYGYGLQTPFQIIQERVRRERQRRRRPPQRQQAHISLGAVMEGVMEELADLIPGYEYDQW